MAKFASIRSLTLFFSENFGGDTTKISFIGLKGEFSEVSSSYFQLASLASYGGKETSPYSASGTVETNQSCNYLTYYMKKNTIVEARSDYYGLRVAGQPRRPQGSRHQ